MKNKPVEAFYTVLLECPLFAGIEKAELGPMLACLGAQAGEVKKGSFVMMEGDPVTRMGVVLAGRVQIIREDYKGNRTIVASIGQGGLFAETFACARIPTMPVSVLATEPCVILFLDYARVASLCPASCSFHSRLIANMLQVLAQKNLEMNSKLSHLARRSTREKLLSYLSGRARQAGGYKFEIPFNRQELADYLCVDRSALSAELSKMQKEGVLEYKRNEFHLL